MVGEQGEDDDRDQEQKRQHAQPHEGELQEAQRRARGRRSDPHVGLGPGLGHAASRAKKWPSTVSWLIAAPLSSALSVPRYMT